MTAKRSRTEPTPEAQIKCLQEQCAYFKRNKCSGAVMSLSTITVEQPLDKPHVIYTVICGRNPQEPPVKFHAFDTDERRVELAMKQDDPDLVVHQVDTTKDNSGKPIDPTADLNRSVSEFLNDHEV